MRIGRRVRVEAGEAPGTTDELREEGGRLLARPAGRGHDGRSGAT